MQLTCCCVAGNTRWGPSLGLLDRSVNGFLDSNTSLNGRRQYILSRVNGNNTTGKETNTTRESPSMASTLRSMLEQADMSRKRGEIHRIPVGFSMATMYDTISRGFGNSTQNGYWSHSLTASQWRATISSFRDHYRQCVASEKNVGFPFTSSRWTRFEQFRRSRVVAGRSWAA
jgi:hypothetical protein